MFQGYYITRKNLQEFLMELRDVTLYCISKRYSVYIFIERRDTTLYRLLGFFLVVEKKRTSLNKYEIWRDFFYLKVRSHSTAVISLKLCLGKWDFTQLTIDWKGQYHEICTLDFYDSNQAWPLIYMYFRIRSRFRRDNFLSKKSSRYSWHRGVKLRGVINNLESSCFFATLTYCDLRFMG